MTRKRDEIDRIENTKRDWCPLIAIGASAGGLAAITGFFNEVPRNCGVAFVVVTHLDPRQKSLLPGILSKKSNLVVVEATDGMIVKPNMIITSKPGHKLVLSGETIQSSPFTNQSSLNFPIDSFFKSVAAERSAKSIGIILSGSGSDGSTGITAIKREFGIVLAQNPKTAEFESMPSNAIATELVDYVVDPQEMWPLLEKYLGGPF